MTLAPQQGAVAGDHGTVKIYDYNETVGWLARYVTTGTTNPFFVGASAGDNLGARRSVAMSDDGMIVAVGSPGFEYTVTGLTPSYPNEGRVTVWVYSSSTQQYTERYLTNNESEFGINREPFQQTSVVSLSSDGTCLAVGGWGPDTTPFGITGRAKLYRWSTANSPNGLYEQVSSTSSNYANSDAEDKYGWTVALSGDGMTFAVGAPMQNYTGEPFTDNGIVRVLQAIDSDNQNLAGRQLVGRIATQYQAPEFDAWTLLDLALTEITALKIKVLAIENDNSN